MCLLQPLYTFIVKILCNSKLKLAEHLTSMPVPRPDQEQVFLEGSGCRRSSYYVFSSHPMKQ